MTPERLQKRIAASGLCSRRKAEEYIVAGKVKVNGRIVKELGTKVTEKDKIEVKNHSLSQKTESITLALYKPRGILTSKSDPFHEETVMDLLPEKYRHLNPVGRLDKDSEGLLLFTSDGDLQNRLTHARYGHKKTYKVLVQGIVDKNSLKVINKGGQNLDNYILKPMKAEIIESKEMKTCLEITLSEGRKRQIRRVLEMLGFPVIKLVRTKIGDLSLPSLIEGKWQILNPDDLKKL